MKKEGLDNVNIRKALAKSYDKEAITTRVLKDGSTPMDYFVPQGLATNERVKISVRQQAAHTTAGPTM